MRAPPGDDLPPQHGPMTRRSPARHDRDDHDRNRFHAIATWTATFCGDIPALVPWTPSPRTIQRYRDVCWSCPLAATCRGGPIRGSSSARKVRTPLIPCVECGYAAVRDRSASLAPPRGLLGNSNGLARRARRARRCTSRGPSQTLPISRQPSIFSDAPIGEVRRARFGEVLHGIRPATCCKMSPLFGEFRRPRQLGVAAPTPRRPSIGCGGQCFRSSCLARLGKATFTPVSSRPSCTARLGILPSSPGRTAPLKVMPTIRYRRGHEHHDAGSSSPIGPGNRSLGSISQKCDAGSLDYCRNWHWSGEASIHNRDLDRVRVRFLGIVVIGPMRNVAAGIQTMPGNGG